MTFPTESGVRDWAECRPYLLLWTLYGGWRRGRDIMVMWVSCDFSNQLVLCAPFSPSHWTRELVRRFLRIRRVDAFPVHYPPPFTHPHTPTHHTHTPTHSGKAPPGFWSPYVSMEMANKRSPHRITLRRKWVLDLWGTCTRYTLYHSWHFEKEILHVWVCLMWNHCFS